MSTSARPTPMPRALRMLFAPAFWLERTKGRKRLALAGLYLVLVLLLGFALWWATSLNGLPHVGDPPGLAAVNRVEMPPDDQNAFTLYRQAATRLVRLDNPELARRFQWDQPWSKAPLEIREWVGQNHEALELWRQGTERNQAVCILPRELNFESDLSLLQRLREFSRLALLEASRVQEAGDPAGAWRWYRAILRSSWHAGSHGCFINRLVGSAMLRVSNGPVSAWADQPQVDASLLRQALGDLTACEAMTPPASEAILIEYQSLMKALNDPSTWMKSLRDDPHRWRPPVTEENFLWLYYLPHSIQARLFLMREPERGRRIVRLYFANWLEQCEKDPAVRPAKVGEPPLFDQPTSGLAPAVLERWLKSSLLASSMIPATGAAQRSIDGDQPILDALKVHLAERLYEREHGRPPRTLGELVGPDLKRLPRGYGRDDPSTLPPPDTEGQNSPAQAH